MSVLHKKATEWWNRERQQLNGLGVYLITGPMYAGVYDFCYRCAGDVLGVNESDIASHPDIRIVRAEQDEKSVLSVKTIRETLGNIRTYPVRAKKRVVIIDGVDTLSTAGQNALLTAIERPPAPTIFFLIAKSIDRVLPTVQSRAIHVPLSFVQHELWPQELQAFFQEQPSSVQLFLEGRPELALCMMKKKRESDRIQKEIVSIDLLLQGSFGKQLAHARDLAKKMDHKELALFLDNTLLLAHRKRVPEKTQYAIMEARTMTRKNINKLFILDHIIFSQL